MKTILLFIFRDNGISIQILMYQLLMELFAFMIYLIMGIFGLKERNIHIFRILGICINFVFFVIQPLFYLNGDANFRNRVLQKGLWKSLKIELFSDHANWTSSSVLKMLMHTTILTNMPVCSVIYFEYMYVRDKFFLNKNISEIIDLSIVWP